jgi:endoglucanase
MHTKLKQFFAILVVASLIALMIPTSSIAAEGDFTNLLVPAAVKASVGGALQICEDLDADSKRKQARKNIVNQKFPKTLCDQNRKPIQLRGMSTHGLQWFPEIVNKNAFGALANDWGANVIRLAMYVGESGYATNPAVKDKVIEGIEYAIANDMYVIVDWHVHAPGNPNAPVYSGAYDFFDEISSLYPNNPHILYELANEPSSNDGGVPGHGVTNDAAGWLEVKNYAEPIIKMLREKGNKNIVIVGSPNWSQRTDLAADNPIHDKNTMYAVHFYTGSHLPDTYVMNNVKYALENGVAVFATEWGTSEASGNNGPFLDHADAWIDFLNKNNISWVNWSLTNKNETSGAFTPFVLGKSQAASLDPGADQVWSPRELSVSGEYVRARIKGISYQPVDRLAEPFSEIVWDFNDGTTQGFAVNHDSPQKNVTVSNVGQALKITGLSASNGVDSGDIWSNLRISSDGRNQGTDLKGADKITMEVIAKAPATVAVAAIPQSAGANVWWANPVNVKATPDSFILQADGSYKAQLTITDAEAPALKQIAENTGSNDLTNLVLFIGTAEADEVKLDNITFSGTRKIIETPIVHAPLGTAALPSTFDDATRQGWNWSGESGVKNELAIKEANGSQALTWEFAYPEVKPSDNWASAPRLEFWKDSLTRGSNQYLAFDLYLNPQRASEGSISISLAVQPPTLGYWAQITQNYTIDLTALQTATVTSDGLYHFQVRFDLNRAGDKVLVPDTELRNFILIFADNNSDFAGRVYMDNVRFE